MFKSLFEDLFYNKVTIHLPGKIERNKSTTLDIFLSYIRKVQNYDEIEKKLNEKNNSSLFNVPININDKTSYTITTIVHNPYNKIIIYTVTTFRHVTFNVKEMFIDSIGGNKLEKRFTYILFSDDKYDEVYYANGRGDIEDIIKKNYIDENRCIHLSADDEQKNVIYINFLRDKEYCEFRINDKIHGLMVIMEIVKQIGNIIKCNGYKLVDAASFDCGNKIIFSNYRYFMNVRPISIYEKYGFKSAKPCYDEINKIPHEYFKLENIISDAKQFIDTINKNNSEFKIYKYDCSKFIKGREMTLSHLIKFPLKTVEISDFDKNNLTALCDLYRKLCEYKVSSEQLKPPIKDGYICKFLVELFECISKSYYYIAYNGRIIAGELLTTLFIGFLRVQVHCNKMYCEKITTENIGSSSIKTESIKPKQIRIIC